MEPTEEGKRLFDLGDRFLATDSEDEKAAIAHEIWQMQADNVWMIGTVGLAPYPIIVDRTSEMFQKSVSSAETSSGCTDIIRSSSS